ncbi:MAG: Ribosomal RNA small subunit methyltransferase E [Firmicutes bacterium]|nr:Ribosomal RNA small subunit methyltransferase E [candidate division NPL-UPA2 bacterium]MBT9153899.1 Ribosomal RNA small subunit methyltransferase E [candidate division NPL-UPA2 bacterium]
MPRFFLSPMNLRDDANPSDSGVITGKEAHHLIAVHRHVVGDVIEVVSGAQVFRAVITGVSAGEVSVMFTEQLVSPETKLEVTLLQGMPKGDKLEFIIQKAVELGVVRVMPVACSRSIATLPHAKAAARVTRWQAIASEAAKQSGRAIVPEIGLPLDFSLAVAQATASLKLVAYEVDGHGLKEVLRRTSAGGSIGSVVCLVGPEGGLSRDEVDRAHAYGFIPVTLGPRILRTETAALALLSTVMYELGDMGGQNDDGGVSHPRLQS